MAVIRLPGKPPALQGVAVAINAFANGFLNRREKEEDRKVQRERIEAYKAIAAAKLAKAKKGGTSAGFDGMSLDELQKAKEQAFLNDNEELVQAIDAHIKKRFLGIVDVDGTGTTPVDQGKNLGTNLFSLTSDNLGFGGDEGGSPPKAGTSDEKPPQEVYDYETGKWVNPAEADEGSLGRQVGLGAWAAGSQIKGMFQQAQALKNELPDVVWDAVKARWNQLENMFREPGTPPKPLPSLTEGTSGSDYYRGTPLSTERPIPGEIPGWYRDLLAAPPAPPNTPGKSSRNFMEKAWKDAQSPTPEMMGSPPNWAAMTGPPLPPPWNQETVARMLESHRDTMPGVSEILGSRRDLEALARRLNETRPGAGGIPGL